MSALHNGCAKRPPRLIMARTTNHHWLRPDPVAEVGAMIAKLPPIDAIRSEALALAPLRARHASDAMPCVMVSLLLPSGILG
jgi:hypothetical protein